MDDVNERLTCMLSLSVMQRNFFMGRVMVHPIAWAGLVRMQVRSIASRVPMLQHQELIALSENKRTRTSTSSPDMHFCAQIASYSHSDPVRPATIVAIDKPIFLELWAFGINNVAIFAAAVFDLLLLHLVKLIKTRRESVT